MPTVRIRTARDLGLALAEARMARDLTQAQVAAATGIERTYLARMERAKGTLFLDRALRVLRRLGAEVTVTFPSSGKD